MNADMIKTLPCRDNILRKQFSNGATVLIHENPWSSTAAICGSLNAGSCLETQENRGVSGFVGSALLGGTRTGNYMRIAEYLQGIGAELSFTSDVHAIRFNGKCLSEDLPDLLGLLKETLSETVFPDNYLEVLKQRVLGGYDTDIVSQKSPAREVFDNLLWGEDHPYGRTEFESDEVIEKITRDDLVKFYNRFLGPENLILGIAGCVNGQEIMDRCEEIFGSWDKAQEDIDEDALFPDVPERNVSVRISVPMKWMKETSIIIGTFGPGISAPDLIAARIGNSILGEFGMHGRIGRVVRGDHGLAYTVCSSLDAWKKGGCWLIRTEVNPENIEKTGSLILNELSRFTIEPVSSREFEDAKSRYIASMPLGFESNAQKAQALHSLEFYQRDPDDFIHAYDAAEAVTPETILETARKWIDPKNLVFVIAGALKENEDMSWWLRAARSSTFHILCHYQVNGKANGEQQ